MVWSSASSETDAIISGLARRGLTTSLASDRTMKAPAEGFDVAVIDTDALVEVPTAVRTLRLANPRASVLAVGAAPSKALLLELLRAGVNDFIEKPIDVDGFAGRIRGMCERALAARSTIDVARRWRGGSPDGLQADMQRQMLRTHEDLQSLEKRLHRAMSQLKTLYHMGRDLADNENWSDALDRFLMALVSFMEADGAALLLFSHGETVLAARSTFQIGGDALEEACGQMLSGWKSHPRGNEIHSLESYQESRHGACLERTAPWQVTIIPLRHRNQALGFLLIEKRYRDGFDFKSDYDFLNTLQTIFVEEIANASYISELRQLSRFNNKVLDNIRSGVVSTDLEGAVRYANVWAADLCPDLRTGRGSRTPAVAFDLLFRSREHPDGLFAYIVGSRRGSHIFEAECHGGKESPFPVRVRTTRMFDDNLNGHVVVAIFEDLTEQRRMEEELRRNDRLRALGQLSAGVAHEIRNPLTGIATSAEVLAEKLSDDEDKKRYVRAMLEEIHRLDGIIRNLLSFARPPRPRFEMCDLDAVVERVNGLVADQATGRGVTVALKPERQHRYCYGDSGQITQVVLNVVLNAIQACESGGEVRVEVHGDPYDAATSAVARIDVTDTGPGVPREVRESLFDPFVTTKSQGTGLGLAISQQIVEDHHGSIRCEFLEKGTRFSIDLPRADATDNEK